ncbi:MAG TPA: hypothetical protein PLA97_08755 [Rubrivivax sp.]|nr:hypothetical protein [Rubrivivax sp.]
MRHPTLRGSRWLRIALAASAAALTQAAAWAAPLVQPGSNWVLFLNPPTMGGAENRQTLVFDGIAQTFVRSALSPVTVTVRESEAELGGGLHAIDLMLDFSGGDPFPIASRVAGFGVGSSNDGAASVGLQLTAPAALTAARMSAVAGNGDALDEDILHLFQTLGQGTPWNGRMFDGFFLGMPWGGRGLQQVTVHFEAQRSGTVPLTGTLPLLILPLLALAWRRR